MGASRVKQGGLVRGSPPGITYSCQFVGPYSKTFFILFLVPVPRGSLGEGPDGCFSEEVEDFGPVPARIPGCNVYC